VSTAAQEANNPKRDMPIGILGSLVICTVLYLAVGFVLTGIVPYDQLNVADPIAVGIDAIGMKWLAPIVKLGAILGSTPWRATVCCRRSPPKCTRAFVRHTSPRS
jgi:basic amino acid/polyamine antiporter, APA family